MGAIALAPSSPEIIYAGAGEAHMGPSKARNFRDNIYYGRGVLKSTDGGASWTLLGAAEFDRVTISKIVVEPSDPNTVYVAVGALATNGVLGNTGIWKSIDGGATWSNTTANISALAAFSDLVMDPANPQVLYAAVGEPGVTDARAANSVYKTTNGGATWARAGNFPLGTTNSQLGRCPGYFACCAADCLRFHSQARAAKFHDQFALPNHEDHQRRRDLEHPARSRSDLFRGWLP
jgi:Sortilin, neurotensin receptor 3,